MCNPAAAQFGFQAVSSIGSYAAQKQATDASNRAKLLNFREDNKKYLRDVILNNVKWKNGLQDADIAYQNLFQQAAESWRQQDLAIEEAQNLHANNTIKALTELYRKEYAGTQTGVTASRLANEGIRKVGMAITNSQRDLMMAKDKSILQKEIIRNDTNRRRRAAFQKTWRSPVHGWTPQPPALEATPGIGGLVLGLAGAAASSFAFGEGGIFSNAGSETAKQTTNTFLKAPITEQGFVMPNYGIG